MKSGGWKSSATKDRLDSRKAVDRREVASTLGREHRLAGCQREHLCRLRGGGSSAPRSWCGQAPHRPSGAGTPGKPVPANAERREQGWHRSSGAPNDPNRTRRGGRAWSRGEERRRAGQAPRVEEDETEVEPYSVDEVQGLLSQVNKGGTVPDECSRLRSGCDRERRSDCDGLTSTWTAST